MDKENGGLVRDIDSDSEWLGSDSNKEEKRNCRPMRSAKRRVLLEGESKHRCIRRPQSLLPRTLQGVNGALGNLKGRIKTLNVHDTALAVRILHAVFVLQKEYLLKVQKYKNQPNHKIKAPQVRKRVCTLFAIGSDQLSSIISTFLNDDRIRESGRRGNFDSKQRRLPLTKKNLKIVREFVRATRRAHGSVNAMDVMRHLQNEGILEIECEEDGSEVVASVAAAHRALHRFLKRSGYKSGIRKGSSLHVKEKLVLARDEYLTIFFQNRRKSPENRLREVYIDESYVHQHHNLFGSSLYEPNDELDDAPRQKHKGRRFCFAAAIQGPSTKDDEPGKLVPNSFWCFCPNASEQKKKDYHKAFNGANFSNWFRFQLLPNLTEPSLIIMDNASYHKTPPEGTPAPQKMKKQEVVDYLSRNGIEFPCGATCHLLKSTLKKHIAQTVQAEVVSLAEQRGHKVLFTPPYHSDLQPIELIWAFVKRKVAKMYRKGTSMSDVRSTLEEQFHVLQTDEGTLTRDKRTLTDAVIEHCVKVAETLYREVDEEESGGGSFSEDETNCESGSECDDDHAYGYEELSTFLRQSSI